MLEAEIRPSGEVVLEGHNVGRLVGFRFTPDSSAAGPDARTASAAAAKALAAEIARRAERLAAAGNGDIAIGADATLRWLGEPVARAVAGDQPLRPRVILLADEHLTGIHRDQVASRLERWLAHQVATVIKPLFDLAADEALSGMARGLAFRLVENFGVLDRREVAADVQALDQEMRAGLRRHGVRFGAYHIFVPALLKPAPTALICLLWSLKNGNGDAAGLAEVPAQLAAGRTSFDRDPAVGETVYRLCGYRVLGSKAVRIDILERLADLIRPALAWKPGSPQPAPAGAVNGSCFVVTPAMLSILGATHESMEVVLSGLGYRAEKKPAAEVAAMLPKAPPADPGPPPAPPAEEEPKTADDAAAATPSLTAETLPLAEAAPAEDGAAAQEAAGEPEPEKFTSLWRPARRPQAQRRGAPSRDDRRHDRPAHARKTEDASAGETSRPPQRQAKEPRRFDRRPDGHSKPGRRDGRPKPERPTEDRLAHDRRLPNKRDARPIDPDSPFAKLAALKARLEAPPDNRDGRDET